MENTLTFLLNLKQSLLGDFEYEVIMLKSMIIIKSLIFFQENDLARKSINLAKNLKINIVILNSEKSFLFKNKD